MSDQRSPAELQQALNLLQSEQQRFRNVLDQLPAYLILLSPDYRVAFANRFFEERFGKSEGRRCYEYLFQRTEPCEKCDTYEVLKTGGPHRWEWTGPDGHNYDIYDFPFTDVDGAPLIMEVGLDITERKRAEGELAGYRERLEELVRERTQQVEAANAQLQAQIAERGRAEENLRRLNRALRARSHSDQAMMRAQEESAYLNEVCQIVVRDCDHAMVWVGYAEDDETKSVRPVANAGFGKGYLETLKITWADTERGRGPTGIAIRTGQPCLCRNMLTDPAFAPWRAEALKRGYASSMALPLRTDGRILGAITIYAREPDSFTDDEVALLNNLADDTAYGIAALRLRQALRESEEQFHTMANAMPQLAWMARADGYITWYNQRWYDYTGTTPEQMAGWGWQSVHDAEALPKVMERWKTCLATGVPFEMEFPLRRADGHFRQFLTRGFPLKNSDGRMVQWFGTNTDITERKQAEETLRRSNARLDLLAETASDLLRSDAPQQIVNSLCRKVLAFLDCQVFFNYLVDEKEGRLHLNSCVGIPEEEARRIEKLDYGTAVCGCVAREGCRIVAEDIQTGSDPRTNLVKAYGIQAYACHPLLMQGRVIGTLSFGTRTRPRFTPEELSLMKAITDQVAIAMERRRSQEALRHVNEELERRVAERTAALRATSLYARSLLEASLDPLVTISPDGKVTDVNKATEHVTGVARDRLIGSDFSSYFTEPDKANAGYQKVLGEGLVRDYPLTIRHASGRTTDVLYNATVYRSEAGAVEGVFAAARDVTERRRTEGELARYREHLEELVRDRTGQLESANARLHESEQRVRRKLESVLSPEGDLGTLDLGDFIDVPALQRLMDDFYAVAHIPMALIDVKGHVLVGVGWQDICTRFHRTNPETGRFCLESDTQLTSDLAQGESRLYKCKNNLWDMATPIFVAGQRLGNVFTGQFFFEDETVDREFFLGQARKYGFDEQEYLAALDGVPRLSRATVSRGIAFLRGLADTLSQLGHSNIKLARLLAEHDRLAHSLRRSEEQLKRAQQIARLGSWELDLNTNKLTWSDEVYRLFGLEPQEFGATYQAFLERVHIDDRAAVDAAYSGSLKDGRNGYEIEHRVVRRDTGEVRIVHEKCEHIRDASGRIIRSVGMVHDITERKKAEEALRELNATLESKVAERTAELQQRARQLEEAWAKVRSESEARIAALEQLRHEDRLKTVGRLASGIAHELGTPLNVISGYAGMIAGGSLSPHDVTESARTIKSQSERIANSVRRILDFARRRPSQRSAVNLPQLVRQTLDLLGPIAQKQNVRLVPATVDETAAVRADVEQLRQVLLNLITNGVQAMPRGGKLEVTVGPVRGRLPADKADAGKYVCISVLDEGEGISEDNLRRLFEPFFTTKGPGKGTGLGLAIADGIVREHGGWITVESALGQGSRFCVHLPKEEETCQLES